MITVKEMKEVLKTCSELNVKSFELAGDNLKVEFGEKPKTYRVSLPTQQPQTSPVEPTTGFTEDELFFSAEG